jgi:hypothetical protein
MRKLISQGFMGKLMKVIEPPHQAPNRGGLSHHKPGGRPKANPSGAGLPGRP